MSVKEVHKKYVECDICGASVCSVSMGDDGYDTFPNDDDKAENLFKVRVTERESLSGGFEHYWKSKGIAELWLCSKCRGRIPKVEPPDYMRPRYTWHEEGSEKKDG